MTPDVAQQSFPLSCGQQRIWFVNQHDPTGAAYNELTGIRLTGSMDAATLEKSLRAIVERHGALHTRYLTCDGLPRQTLDHDWRFSLRVTDLGELPQARREADARRLAVEEARIPFDLRHGIPIRARLVRLAQHDHLLLITIHHIAFDGWSQEILWRELATCYEAFRRSEEPRLPQLPWQVLDFADWQSKRQQDASVAQQLAYWRHQLDGAPAVATLPSDYSRPAVQSFKGGHQTILLPEKIVAPLKAMGRDAGATLYMALLAAFNVLLHRYTGQCDIVIGTPYAGRQRKEVVNLIGFFVNTLALRTDVSGDPTFRELLARVREVALQAFDHAEAPFDRVVEQLRLERNRGYAPLVQVMFQLRRHPGRLAAGELAFSEYRIDTGTAKSELALEVSETPDGLCCEAEFSTDLFEPATVRRLLESYQALLESIVSDPNQRLSRLNLLPPPERHRVLALGTSNLQNPSRRDTADVVRLFCEQARERADAVAVTCGGCSLTYGQLNQRANQLARHLRSAGIAAGSRVAVYDDRSIDLVVGILGIFKAGATYVPLDSDLPSQRLRVMLDDVRPGVVLTRRKFLSNLSGAEKPICWDVDEPRILAQDDSDLPTPLAAEHVAYILFTSGSSGQPKGVMVSHGSLASHCDRIRDEYELTCRDRVLQFAPACFDPSLEQIFATLLAGATLVMRGNAAWGGEKLWQETRDAELTVVNVPPGVFRQWIRAIETSSVSKGFGRLRLVIVGGDVLSGSAAAAWRAIAPPSIRLLNAYGPTEATITATVFDVGDHDAKKHGPRVPIGRPAGNSCVYILDANLDPVPIGVAGEIHLGGEGVALGYWNRPELTAERFIVDPYAGAPHARLYKSGDLARWLPDGNIDFLGRSDDQVKVGGCRIEPAEIEAALNQHPQIRESVVTTCASGDEKQLIAYLVFRPGHDASTQELRRFLRTQLPAFMIPSFFVALDSLPWTLQGKIDHQRLPAPMPGHGESRHERVAPRSVAEERLARIWQKLLDVDCVGVTDNFFELGGHSLLVAELFAAIHKAFGIDLPVSSILSAPTIEQMAILLETHGQESAGGSLVPLETGGSGAPFFCVHAVGGQALRYRALASMSGAARPFYAIEAQGIDGKQLPQGNVEAMAAAYLREITARQPQGPYYLGGYCSGGIVAFEMAQQLLAAGKEVGHVVLIDTCHPRLWEDPSWKQRVFRAIKRRVRTAVHHGYQRIGRRTPSRITLRLVNECLRRAFTQYRARPYPGRVTLIRSTTHPYGEHRLLGWESLVREGTPVRIVPGDHTRILDDSHVRHAARALRETLDEPAVGRLARAA